LFYYRTSDQSVTPHRFPKKWNEHHSARKLIFNEIKAGWIPLDQKKMEFKMEGMEYGNTFTGRLLRLRKMMKKDKKLAKKDGF